MSEDLTNQVSQTNRWFKMKLWTFKLMLHFTPLSLLLWCLNLKTTIESQGFWRYNKIWSEELNLHFGLFIDGTSFLFLQLIGFIGLCVGFYSIWYFDNKKLEKFFIPFMAFFLSMVGVVISDHLILLFIFWELTSFTSFFLIGFNHEIEKNRKSALQALLVTGIGGLFLLAGISVLGNVTHLYSISELANSVVNFQNEELLPLTFILFFVGCMTKSAQWPFHFWLPNSMSAPAPASAFLHSATMVKAGIFLLLKISPIFSHLSIWKFSLIAIGGITFIWPLIVSNFKDDLKSILANTTISSLGLMTFLIGYGSELSLTACLFYLFSHAIYKSSLFLLVGIIEKQTGSRSLNELSALVLKMPKTFWVFFLTIVSFVAVFPTFHFITKEFILESLLSNHEYGLTVLIFLGVGLSTCIGLNTVVSLFLKERTWINQIPKIEKVKEASILFLFPSFILAMAGLLLGLIPNWILDFSLRPSIIQFFQEGSELHLSLWHGLNKSFVISMASLGFGIILAFWQKAAQRAISKLTFELPSGSVLFDLIWDKTLLLGKRMTYRLQNERLVFYVSSTICSYLFISFVPVLMKTPSISGLTIQPVNTISLALIGIIIFFSLILLMTTQTIKAMVGFSVIGFSIALFFGIHSAPDLALTQFAVESLVLILIANSLTKLPKINVEVTSFRKIFSVALALICGVAASLLTYGFLTEHQPSRISPYFLEHSLKSAFGSNVVNVILVDFRGFDTLGEITVLVIAAIGITQLIKMRSRKANK